MLKRRVGRRGLWEVLYWRAVDDGTTHSQLDLCRNLPSALQNRRLDFRQREAGESSTPRAHLNNPGKWTSPCSGEKQNLGTEKE